MSLSDYPFCPIPSLKAQNYLELFCIYDRRQALKAAHILKGARETAAYRYLREYLARVSSGRQLTPLGATPRAL